MDWLTFIAEIIKATAWPIVLAFILITFREPLLKLIRSFADRPLEAKWGDKEFKAGVYDVKRRSENLPVPQEDKRLFSIISKAPISPKSTIIEAWKNLEEMAISASDVNANTPLADIRISLESAGILDDSQSTLFADLQKLRNEAEHSSVADLNVSTAIDYAEAAHRLARYITEQKKGL